MKPPDSLTRRGRVRVTELDALRGLALLMMVLHHFIFDLRFLLGLDVFAWQESRWFELMLRPFFLNVFLIVSGICCTFSRSNGRRGLRLLLVAMVFTLATPVFSALSGFEFRVYFNVLHVLAIGILLYALLSRGEKGGARRLHVDVLLMLFSVTLIYAQRLLPLLPAGIGLGGLPLGVVPSDLPTMSDYLPLVPWLGFFLIGAEIGRVAYAKRKSVLPPLPRWLGIGLTPLQFLGRHSLLVYILHQPILLAILFGLRGLGLI